MVRSLLAPIGPVTQGWGPSTLEGEPSMFGYAHFHAGIDYSIPTGTTLRAADDGVIGQAGQNGGFGISVTESIGDGYTVLWGHMARVTVQPGQQVKRGDTIGYSNNTGYSTGPHVHFEVRRNGTPVNPTTVGLVFDPDVTTGGGDLTGPPTIGGVPIPNPFEAITDALGSMKDVLANPDTWLRGAMVIGGVVIVAMGAYALAKPAIDSAGDVTKKAALMAV